MPKPEPLANKKLQAKKQRLTTKSERLTTTEPTTVANTAAGSRCGSRPLSIPASAACPLLSQLPPSTETVHTRSTRNQRARRIQPPRAPVHLLCLAIRDIEKRRLFRSRFQSRYGQARKANFRAGSRLLRKHRCWGNYYYCQSATKKARSQPQTVYRTSPNASMSCGARPPRARPNRQTPEAWTLPPPELPPPSPANPDLAKDKLLRHVPRPG